MLKKSSSNMKKVAAAESSSDPSEGNKGGGKKKGRQLDPALLAKFTSRKTWSTPLKDLFSFTRSHAGSWWSDQV
uniref:Uncharacterized protein n=1 Tax=Brassica campestris TaxID=3711 RepID=A0A3P6B8B8_BRACM|nr:unnamed protein product [Brassica rapa]